jgi:hypothetical protein
MPGKEEEKGNKLIVAKQQLQLVVDARTHLKFDQAS